MKYPKDYIDKILCGDCLELMKGIPDESIDFCIADPPFNVGKSYGAGYDDKKPEKEYWNYIRSRLKETFRILKENSRLYIFHTDKGIFKLRPLCESIGFKYHQTLIWHKTNLCTFRSGRIVGDWHYMHENILLFHKGKKTNMIKAERSVNCFSVFIYPVPQSNFKGGRDHPAQKPIGLLADIISRTPGQIIIDPFCGVGSSLVAAKNLLRNFIGIEINPGYCKIAEDRLRQGVL